VGELTTADDKWKMAGELRWEINCGGMFESGRRLDIGNDWTGEKWIMGELQYRSRKTNKKRDRNQEKRHRFGGRRKPVPVAGTFPGLWGTGLWQWGNGDFKYM